MPERRNQKRTMIITEVMSRWDLLLDSLPSVYHRNHLTLLKMMLFASSSLLRLSPEFQTEGYAGFAGYSFRAFAGAKIESIFMHNL